VHPSPGSLRAHGGGAGMRLLGFVAGCLLLVGISACSGGSDATAGTTSVPERSTTTRPGQVVASTSLVPKDSGSLDRARAAVERARGELPFPDDVLECLAVRASSDSQLLNALSGESTDREAALAAAASCSIEVRAAPRFAEDLQRAAGGDLSREQLTCAAREYRELSPEEITAAAGAVLNPRKADPSETAPIEAIYMTCDIEKQES